MFAPKLARPHTVVANSTHSLARQRPTPEAAKGSSEARRAAWDFSKIPVFGAGAVRGPQGSSVLSAPALPGHGPCWHDKSARAIGADDACAHEADTVASRVMRMDGTDPDTRAAVHPQHHGTPRCAATTSASALRSMPFGVQAALAGAGHTLDAQTRGFFEPRLGIDLGDVRIHDDRRAATSARAMGARAYTVGSDIVFGAGEYEPATAEGRVLLAHELAHVRQDALGAFPAVLLRRKPCPGCHKPAGTQDVALAELHDGDVHYLPDEAAADAFAYLRAGLAWGEYRGGKRIDAQAVHHYYYDGGNVIVGYVLKFENPQGSNFPVRVLTLDVYGKVLASATVDREPVESVISPVDFIGPGVLARPFAGGVRAVAGGIAEAAPRFGAALGRTARNLTFSARLAAPEFLGAAMRGGADFSALAAEGGARTASALVTREGGELVVGATQAGRAAAELAPGGSVVSPPPLRITNPSFADVSEAIQAEAPGTIRYASGAAAAVGARAAGLEKASRPGFQSHGIASSVRQAFRISGAEWQSAHIAPQAFYRELRRLGIRVSEGRALTTLLSREAHAAFDRSWLREWRSAVASGRQIRISDVYTWVSNAIDAVDRNLIDVSVQGAMHDRLRSELFSDLGLSPDLVIVPGHP